VITLDLTIHSIHLLMFYEVEVIIFKIFEDKRSINFDETGRNLSLITRFYLVTKLQINGAIPPLPVCFMVGTGLALSLLISTYHTNVVLMLHFTWTLSLSIPLWLFVEHWMTLSWISQIYRHVKRPSVPCFRGGCCRNMCMKVTDINKKNPLSLRCGNALVETQTGCLLNYYRKSNFLDLKVHYSNYSS
jgi:hypothetical protein